MRKAEFIGARLLLNGRQLQKQTLQYINPALPPRRSAQPIWRAQGRQVERGWGCGDALSPWPMLWSAGASHLLGSWARAVHEPLLWGPHS